MAYQSYNPYSFNNYLPYQQNYTQNAIHNGGIVNVQSEQEARYYPVAPATSVLFKNEKEPYVYVKTVGNSMEAPLFEVYKRIDDEIKTESKDENKAIAYVEKSEFDAFKNEFETLKSELTKSKKAKKDE